LQPQKSGMSWWYYFIPVIGACIGWMMNRLLLKLLFHPRKQTRIFGISFQGIIPKKQPELALQLGKLAKELLSFTDLEQKITSADNFNMIRPQVETHVDEFLRVRLKEAFPWIGSMIGERTINDLKVLFMNELERIFPMVMQGYLKNLGQQLDLEQLVSNKLTSLSTEMLENRLNREIGKELRFVGVFGALTGLIVGLVALLAIYMAK
jgi:uncharacterized membrane protein YheB (UPF0754 family)